MKIKFVIGWDPAHSILSEWEEIVKLTNEINTPSRGEYLLFKSLEYNDLLHREVLKERVYLKIPQEGISQSHYLARAYLQTGFCARPIGKAVKRLKKRLKINLLVEEQLSNLILGDYIEIIPRFGSIGLLIDSIEVRDNSDYQRGRKPLNFDDYTKLETVSINVGEKVSKNRLINFIEQNWDSIKLQIAKLPDCVDFFISEKDMKILEYRDKKQMKYRDIADQIAQQYGQNDLDSAINEDSVKTSYTRAKSKIDQLTTWISNTSVR